MYDGILMVLSVNECPTSACVYFNGNILTDTLELGALCPQHIKPFVLVVSHKKVAHVSHTLQNGEDGKSVT